MAQVPKTESFECGIHDLTYRATSPGCPVCWHERERKHLQDAVRELNGKMNLLAEQNHALRVWQDLSVAIREASGVLDDNDMAFLKATLYEWRNEKSLTMKTTHGPRDKKKRRPASPNGFIVMPRKGDPYGHLCTSVGGMAVAEYYDEALNTYGTIKAMEILVRGLAQHLPGGHS